jgi:CrcB protein
VNFLLVAVAGAVGAPVRYLVDAWIQRHNAGIFPWGTLLINATGSFLLGLITGLALYHALPETDKLLIGTGFCGAYTTFSTFTFESVRLAEDGSRLEAVANAAGSLIIGLLLAAAGLGVAAAL